MFNNRSINVVKLISDSDKVIFDTVNFVFISGIISIFGIVTNVMNMVVFYKQGFSNTMNISFFGLAFSDLCGLIALLWCGVVSNPLLVNSDVPIVASDVFYIAAASPHCIFVRITGWITVYITAERCLCITLPLKIKQIVTPRRTATAICVIYIVIVASFLPEHLTAYLDWKFFPERNRSMLAIAFTQNRKSCEGLLYILISTLGSVSFVVVIVFTATLVIQLIKKSKWRKTANAQKTHSDSLSSRDKKAMNMVVMIATVLIVCYTPGVVASIVSFSDPKVKLGGVNINVFYVMWSFVFIFDAINSSVNIFLYYKMSSKFRDTFNIVFRICKI